MKPNKTYVPTFKTCQLLKEAKWVKPTLHVFLANGDLFRVAQEEKYQLDSGFFAPMFQEIVEELPHTLSLQLIDGIWRITANHEIGTTIVIKHKNINEAVAQMWLKIQGLKPIGQVIKEWKK